MNTKQTYVMDFSRGGRTVHLWEQRPHPFWGSKLRALCCEKMVQANTRYIAADDKRCPKCREISEQRRTAAA
jgi:hypothetical protein